MEVVRSQARWLGASPSQLAIAWVLRAIAGSVAVVGIKRADQLRDVLGALQLDLPAETLAALDAVSTDPATGSAVTKP